MEIFMASQAEVVELKASCEAGASGREMYR